MAARIESVGGVPDAVKWLIAGVLVLGGIAAFYYWSDVLLLVRVIGLLVVFGVATAVAIRTEKGRIAVEFIRESRTEVRKVVWPTRKETTQTTLIVIAMVSVVAIIMWMLDAGLAWFIARVLGNGG